MIKNLWAVTKIYCGNHEEPIEMILKQGPKSLFYACPDYEKRYQGEKGCPNRVSTEIVEKILEHIAAKIQSVGSGINLTGYKFTVSNVSCTVLKHHPYGALSLMLINKKVISK